MSRSLLPTSSSSDPCCSEWHWVPRPYFDPEILSIELWCHILGWMDWWSKLSFKRACRFFHIVCSVGKHGFSNFDNMYAQNQVDEMDKKFVQSITAARRDLSWSLDGRYEILATNECPIMPLSAFAPDYKERIRKIKALTAARYLRKRSNMDHRWNKGYTDEELEWLDAIPLPPPPNSDTRKRLRPSLPYRLDFGEVNPEAGFPVILY